MEDERRRELVEEDEDDEHDHRLATVHTPGNIMMRFGWRYKKFANFRVLQGVYRYSGPILIDRTVLYR